MADPVDLVAEFNDIAIGHDGLPIINYYDFTSRSLRSAKCNDIACVSADETIVSLHSSSGTVGQYASIAIDIEGFPIHAYVDSSDGELMFQSCGNTACNRGGFSSILDFGNFSGTDIAVGTDGWPIVAYYDFSSDVYKVASCNDATCKDVAPTISILDDVAPFGGAPAIAIGRNGLPVISYVFRQSSVSYLRVAQCNDTACAGGDETITTLISTSQDIGRVTSIAIADTNYPVISYFNSSTGAYRTLKCNDEACIGGDETDSFITYAPGWRGHSSISIGSDGYPVLSFEHQDAGSIELAKCHDVECNSVTVTLIDEFESPLVSYNAIAIGADGFPIISYHDPVARRLKVAHCATLDCTEPGGVITIIKDTGPAGPDYNYLFEGILSFPFDGDLGGFTLFGGDSISFTDLEPGIYGVFETVPNGWDLTKITCDDPTENSSTKVFTAFIEMDPGESVTCTFFNTQPTTFTVYKTFSDGKCAERACECQLFQWNCHQ